MFSRQGVTHAVGGPMNGRTQCIRQNRGIVIGMANSVNLGSKNSPTLDKFWRRGRQQLQVCGTFEMYNDEVDFQCEVLLTLKRFWGPRPLPPPLEFLMKFEEVFHPRPARKQRRDATTTQCVQATERNLWTGRGRERRALDRVSLTRVRNRGEIIGLALCLCHDSKHAERRGRGDRDFVAMLTTPHAEILARCHELRKILRCESLPRDASWEWEKGECVQGDEVTCISFRILAVNEVDAYVIIIIQNIPIN